MSKFVLIEDITGRNSSFLAALLSENRFEIHEISLYMTDVGKSDKLMY